MTWAQIDSGLEKVMQAQEKAEEERRQARRAWVKEREERLHPRPGPGEHVMEIVEYISRGYMRYWPACSCDWQASDSRKTRERAEQSWRGHRNWVGHRNRVKDGQ